VSRAGRIAPASGEQEENTMEREHGTNPDRERMTEDMKRKAEEMKREAQATAAHAGERAREQFESASEAVRGRFAEAGETFTGMKEHLQERDFQAMAEEITDMIRRHPVQSLLVGAGLGYVIGRIMGR
jgi:ElaB/YqjD/DUF883 family membrane-anchored ribosome-binding protein